MLPKKSNTINATPLITLYLIKLYMIIIERTYKGTDENGKTAWLKERKCFSEDDIVGVQQFIDQDGDYEYKSFSAKKKKGS